MTWTRETLYDAHAAVIDLRKERERRQEQAAVVRLYPRLRKRVTPAVPVHHRRYCPDGDAA